MRWRRAGLNLVSTLTEVTVILTLIFTGGRAMAKNDTPKSGSAKVATWLGSGEFQFAMDNALTNILKGAQSANSEADTANVFEREIYFLLRQQFGIGIDIQKEVSVSGIVHNFGNLAGRTSGKGRMDAVINSLVIEYKHRSKLRTAKQKQDAITQVGDYLRALAEQDGVKRSAVLTDGLTIAYFDYVGDVVRNTQLRMLSKNDLEIIVKAIINNQTKKFEPKNIVKDFSVSAQWDGAARKLACALFQAISGDCTEKTRMLFEEWKGLMHLSVEDNGKSADIAKRREDLSGIFGLVIANNELEYKALFALQTTYAIIVKLIACKVLDNINFSDDARGYHDLVGLTSGKLQHFLQMMEDGYSYRNRDVRNFLEGDFFSWYADTNQWNGTFFSEIKEIICIVDDYSAFSFNVRYNPMDVFKDLYMGIIPQSIRHSMGEYFTPEWLADCVVSRALEMLPEKRAEKWKAIDPCCGSGIFVVSLIKKVVGDRPVADMTKEERQRLINEILQRVHGIDINPLSVLSARVSYFLALHRLGEVSDVEIPVYLGDSAIIPDSKNVDGIPCYAYSVNNLKCKSFDIVLPQRFVKRNDFGEAMSKLQALVKAECPEALYNVFYENLSKPERESETLIEGIKKLSESLVELHQKQWDGIWIRIAMNFMMIARLDSFDLIVGNPPWVKWEHLPAAYTRKIKDFCDIRHIFCNDGGMFGGAQLNICALIANVTASNWLDEDGVLAFLMPDSIMSQNSYEEFRNFYIDYEKNKRLYLQGIDRWLPPLRPFKVGNKSVTQDFNTYYYASKVIDYSSGVPVRTIGKKKGVGDVVINECMDFRAAQRHLDIGHEIARQLSADSTAFTYVSHKHDFGIIVGDTAYRYRTGVESTPFEVFKMEDAGPSQKKQHHRFRNKTLKTSRYKVDDIPPKGWDFPTRYIYPMLEGPSIKPFCYDCAGNYHVVPYDQVDTTRPVPFARLSVMCPELATYFSNHRNLLDCQSEKSKAMHRGDEFYALSKIGPYTFAPYIVAARDNSTFCATVVRPTMTAWGEKKHTVCVKHTIIISQDKDDEFISEDEAHFINGILNSSIVHAYIHSTFKANGFSLNKARIFMPKYDPSNERHVKLAEISRRATGDSSYRNQAPEDLTRVYLDLCRATENRLFLSSVSTGHVRSRKSSRSSTRNTASPSPSRSSLNP